MNPFDFLDKVIGSIGRLEIQTINFAIGNFARVDHSLFVIGLVLFVLGLFFIFPFVVILQKNQSNVAIDVIAIKNPMGRTFEQP